MELLTVITLIGILAVITDLSMKDYAQTVRLQSAADMVGSDIRKARQHVFVRKEPCHIDFEPNTGTYLVNGVNRVTLPKGISFGTAPGVTGKPSDPYTAPPKDGITFKAEGAQNRALFLTKGLVVPTGAVYLTNGKETMAITVALNGHTTQWRSNGGNKWIEL